MEEKKRRRFQMLGGGKLTLKKSATDQIFARAESEQRWCEFASAPRSAYDKTFQRIVNS